MFLSLPMLKRALVGACSLALLSSCIHKKYETPIAKTTQQPDKILFDSAMHSIERGQYEVARISLQTLMNTYESSEYLAKAKLAIADSWFREGGSNGLGQAEAEYKDFQLFYPQMEESAQAQDRICDIHYKQMDKSDRDIIQTLRAETECKDLITQYPNSKFVPSATQKLREVQESLAAHEFAVGDFYHTRQMNPAAANRLNALVDQYPLYSGAGQALYEAGDSYSKMGPRFRKQAGEMFARLVRDYPLDPRVKDATKRLQDMELPVPAPSQAALERAKWEQENFQRLRLTQKAMNVVKSSPDLSHAARSGAPTMTDPKKTIPYSIPVANAPPSEAVAAAAGGVAAPTKTDVSVTADTTTGTSLEKKTADAAQQPLPTNRDKEIAQMKAKQKKQQDKLAKKKKKPQPDQAAPSATTPAITTPATTTTPASASATTPAPQI
jgi:outer membrane protein assembly factor BamD